MVFPGVQRHRPGAQIRMVFRICYVSHAPQVPLLISGLHACSASEGLPQPIDGARALLKRWLGYRANRFQAGCAASGRGLDAVSHLAGMGIILRRAGTAGGMAARPTRVGRQAVIVCAGSTRRLGTGTGSRLDGFSAQSAAGTLRRACAMLRVDAGDAQLVRLGENAIWRLDRAGLVVRIARSTRRLATVEKELAVARWLASLGFPAVRVADSLEQWGQL
jgi:hypothetical protein